MTKTKAAAAALLLATGLSACGGLPHNRSLYSEHQPIVTRSNYVFDVMTGAGGVPLAEQRRLAGWFEAMDISYGDKVAVDASRIAPAARDDLIALADRQGVIMGETAPVTEGEIGAGVARVVLTRSVATVEGCPDWKGKSDFNPNNATAPGYGCSINTNMAAMIADPQDLLRGQAGTGETVVMSSTKAIETYRNKAPTGQGALKQVSSDE